MRFLNRAHVGADGDFDRVGETEHAHGLAQFGGRGVLSKLADESRSDAGNDLVALEYGLYQLENLALVRNRGEGAVDEALAAGHALVIVYLGAAELVGANGVHAAGAGAGALQAADGVVRALVQAAAAFDALVLVDNALAVTSDGDGVLGTDVHAGVRQAALAVGGDADLLRRAGVAGEGDDIYERGLIVLLGQGGFFYAVAGQVLLRGGAQRQSAGETQPFGDYGALQKDVVAVLRDFSWYDFIRQSIYFLVVAALIGEPCDFCENVPAKIIDYAVYTSHVWPPFTLNKG